MPAFIPKLVPVAARRASVVADHVRSRSMGRWSGWSESPMTQRSSKFVSAAATGIAMASLLRSKGNNTPVECCGIVGYIGPKDAESILTEGVKILQNRGYDSCGIATIDNSGDIVTTKFASTAGSTSDCVERLVAKAPENHSGHHIGIGHTRWATHGGKTDNNAHPHHDYKDRIALIHNGTIENYAALKDILTEKGITFRSETDTEVIANHIGMLLDGGMQFEQAFKNTVGVLRGTWGLVCMHRDRPDRLLLARNGSPIVVGSNDDEVFVASEPLALARHTNQFLTLKDGEIVEVCPGTIDHLVDGRELQTIQERDVETSPHPFPHWTIKEIYEQPRSLARALNHGGRVSTHEARRAVLGGLDNNKESLNGIKDLLITGCGTSLYAGMYGERIMQYMGSLDSVRVADASEVDAHTFKKDKEGAGVLFLSQSGETYDVVRACQLADTMGVKKLSVVNVVGSLIARMTNCGVYLNAGREVAVASTKAFTSQVAVLSLVACWFAQQARRIESNDRVVDLVDAIHRLPVYAGMTLQCEDKIRAIAEKIKGAKTMFVLGKGFGYPAALEGALKIKEISYIHAEGFAGGALKHGPFAMIDGTAKTPVVLLVLADEHAAFMLNAAEQVKARGAHLICITDDPEITKGVADDTIVVPSNGPLSALLCTIPMQLLAYHLSVAKGINPDKPRGLAKTVTVS